MKSICFAVLVLLTTGCQRKLSATEVKNNLEKAMATYLQQHQHTDTPPLRFDMIDVTYQETDSNYQCRFTIKLYRPDGTDTTGVISSKVSKDFSSVSAK
jgi:Holliday junction resolvase-like predicted endonuclease